MSGLIYNWNRYWCLRDGSGLHLDSNGFLLRSEYFKDTFEFRAIADVPCVILLGEPGIGKSQAVREAVHLVAETFSHDRCFSLDLRSFGSDVRLYESLFRSKEITDWVSGNHRLHLFLDSFDECLLRVDTVATLLADEFKTGNYPIDRLLFRLASRTAEFPKGLENSLREIWAGNEKVQVYELCPLQASDVHEAALVNKLNAENFFREVVFKRAGSLAARPITLSFLLNLYRKNNQLPSKLTELYEEGCRVLCDEQNEDRRSSRRLRGSLAADQKLIIAARIAAVMVLCNRMTVWKDGQNGENEETDILMRELSGFSEVSNNIDFSVSEEDLRETLFHTGLFTARGPHRIGWAHQTFAEFLAAWYLSRHELGLDELLSLITHPLDDKHVTPQLQEAAAWLASLCPDLFEKLLKTNPILLLRSDVASFSPDSRAKLVDSLLKIFREERASDWGLDYHRLKHPDLASQILPVIRNKDAHYLARRFAIDVAEACELHELQHALADVILDETEPDFLRANAGYALWRVGNPETRRRIKHFALNGTQNDRDERVRGVAFLCNWNENMNAEEVFSSLVPAPDLHDSYSLFLAQFTEKLRPHDLPVALRWVKEKSRDFEDDYSVARVIDEIMLLGWRNLTTPGVLPLFAEASLVRLRDLRHDLIDFANIRQAETLAEVLADSKSRRSILAAIVPLIDEEKHDSLYVSRSRLLQPRTEDLHWLLDQLNEAKSTEEQKGWLQFLGAFYHGWEVPPENLSVLEEAYQHNDAVKNYYSWVFTPVELNSSEAQSQKDNYQRWTALQSEAKKLEGNALDPPPRERVLERLDRFEKGQIDSWWDLNMQLTLKPFMRVYGDEFQFDLRKLPGWEDADMQTRARIVNAAREYLRHGDPRNSEWVGTNKIFRPAFSGYRALYLLHSESPKFLEQLTTDIWQKWAAIIVSYPLNSSGADEMIPHQSLVIKVYEHASDKVIETTLKQFDAANNKGEMFYFAQRLEVCWDDKFKNAFRGKLRDSETKTITWGRLLEDLIKHGDAPTQIIAQNVLNSFVAGGADKDRAMFAAASLMQYGEGRDWWPFVWKAIKKDADFGKALIESVCSQIHPSRKLKEEELVEFYFWLVRVFPPAEDPEYPKGVFTMTTRMEITKFRNSCLHDLKQRGTRESVEALQKIAEISPTHNKELPWILIEAKENFRRNTWKPLTPIALLNLLKRPKAGQPQTNLDKFLIVIQSNLFWGGGVGLALAAYSLEWSKVPLKITFPMLAIAWMVICISIYIHRFFESRSKLLQSVLQITTYLIIAAIFVVMGFMLRPVR